MRVLKSVAQCAMVSLEMLQVVFNARFERPLSGKDIGIGAGTFGMTAFEIAIAGSLSGTSNPFRQDHLPSFARPVSPKAVPKNPLRPLA
jgi:hypothetical protein